MAILEERKRVIDTFVAKDLAKSSRTLARNSEVYRAFINRAVNEEPLGEKLLKPWYND